MEKELEELRPDVDQLQLQPDNWRLPSGYCKLFEKIGKRMDTLVFKQYNFDGEAL